MSTIRLNKLPLNKSSRITEIYEPLNTLTRYYELGISPGAEITPVLESPLKNPKGYLINGYIVVLRNENAENIKVITE